MIIINGASRGIGKFLLEKYQELGEKVFGTFCNTKPKSNSEVYIKVDVRDYKTIEKLYKKINPIASEITLINCTGINYNSFAHKANINQWKDVIQVNLIGTFSFINIFLPKMREQHYGRIINLSSVVAQRGIPGTSAYAASKSGLWGMTRSIAIENTKHGITINNLNLGYFEIGMISDIPKEYQEIILKDIPTHKFGEPSQIFDSCQFLRNNNYINGTSIDISAGLI